MAGAFGPGPLYAVSGWGAEFSAARGFRGPRAFTDASDFYDALRARADVDTLLFSRWDGREWGWVVPPVRRGRPPGRPRPPAE
jgi:hypothetical protein